MVLYSLDFIPGVEERFKRLDRSVQLRVWKKIQQLKQPLQARHLKQGVPFFVAEVGQYRIAYVVDEERKIKRMHFVGDHKEYEAWLGL